MMTFAYPWNAPRLAIASPYPTYDQQQHRDRLIAAWLHGQKTLNAQARMVQLDVRRRMALLEKQQGTARANAYLAKTFVERTLPRVESVNQRYQLHAMRPGIVAQLSRTLSCPQGAARAAGTLWELMKRFNRLPDMSRADVDLLAGDIASFIHAELVQLHASISERTDYRYVHHLYTTAAIITRELGQTPPLWETVSTRFFCPDDVTAAILRMQAEKWWKGQLRRLSAFWREHLHIALANVSKKRSPYASPMAVAEWREQRRRTRDFLQSMDLEDEEGNRISLIEKYDGSVANPAIRRAELMTRIRGFETLCQNMGFRAEFYTLTAPSRYHATLQTGHRNAKWNGASPADTQRYLCTLWQRVRAKLHRNNISIFGLRVAEPHHDGTPHWHMLMFMRPEDVSRVSEILRDYACQQDSDELNSARARKARFHAEAIDPAKGSATGYIAKYVAKNIDGYALEGERDHESGKPLKETAMAVSAWAARWRIRQFQFIGGAPVTVYRELRRLADLQSAHGAGEAFAAVHAAADAGQWAAYTDAQGGPFVKRDALTVRVWYQPDENCNAFGEETQSIKGVYATATGPGVPVLTRLKTWKVVPKRAEEEGGQKPQPALRSWSSVNNCTSQTYLLSDSGTLSAEARNKVGFGNGTGQKPFQCPRTTQSVAYSGTVFKPDSRTALTVPPRYRDRQAWPDPDENRRVKRPDF